MDFKVRIQEKIAELRKERERTIIGIDNQIYVLENLLKEEASKADDKQEKGKTNAKK